MTDREKAIVMAYTGIAMLSGDKIKEFYKYLDELYGRPVYTHEIAIIDIPSKAKKDFIELCRTEEKEEKWIPCTKRLPTKEEYIANNGLFIVSDGDRTYAEYFDVYNSFKYFGEPTMNGFRADRCVTAWMPLPEPCKG